VTITDQLDQARSASATSSALTATALSVIFACAQAAGALPALELSTGSLEIRRSMNTERASALITVAEFAQVFGSVYESLVKNQVDLDADIVLVTKQRLWSLYE
jgi:hypothetical protein